ncbi:MAG: TIGR02556 family CRISPR-associated protein [Candidatus Caldarchaeum sp.]
MLDSLRKLGQLVQEAGLEGYIRPLARKSGKSRKDEKYLVKLIFDVDRGEVKAERILFTEELTKQYRYVGHTQRASREPVARLTVKDIKYVAGGNNVITNIRKKIGEMEERIGGIGEEIRELDRELAEIEEKFVRKNDFAEKVYNAVRDYQKDALLYTICVRHGGVDTSLAETKGYEMFLKEIMRQPIDTATGTCHICGGVKDVLPDPAFDSASLLKIYVVDKKGFMSGISESDRSKLRTFAVCKDCREQLMLGWNFVREKLVIKNVRGLNTYLIPNSSATVKDYDRWCDYIKSAYDAVSSYDGLMNFESRLREFTSLHDEQEWYSLNIIFAKAAGAHFDLKTFIQDVPLTRLSRLRDIMKTIGSWSQQILGGEQSTWSIGFNEIYEIFPLVADRRGEPREYRPLLELFQAMLSGTFYLYERLVKAAVLCARIHRYESYEGFSVRLPNGMDSDKAMCVTLLKHSLLMCLLRDVGVMSHVASEKDGFEELVYQLPENIREWFKRMEYNGFQKALFLLGCLVGKVGHAQYRKNDKKKSILDKIDFNGMGGERVLELAVRVFKSLRDYRILSYNEGLYHIMKALLDKYVNELRRNPLENVFYILSGYAFETYQTITGGSK